MAKIATYQATIIILTIALAVSTTTATYFALRNNNITPSPTAAKTNPIISNGTLDVPFNSISYLPFTIPTQPTLLNISFYITNFNSYYPQSIALYLLNPNQYNTFQSGDHTTSTWYYPYSTSLNTQLTIPNSGNWYLAFSEQDPNGGFPAITNYTLRLASHL